MQAILNEGAYESAAVEVETSTPRSKYNYALIAEALKAGKKWVCAPTITKGKFGRVLSETRKLMPDYKISKGTLKKKLPTDPTQFVLYVAGTKTPATKE